MASSGNGTGPAARISRLQELIAAAGLTAFLVPRVDAHRGEIVPACEQRLAWLTGFTGSAGMCVVAAERASIFVDGRYALQARNQIDTSTLELNDLSAAAIGKWISDTAPQGSIIGYDPQLHSKADIDRLQGFLEGSAIRLRKSDNLIDRIWHNRPAPPRTRVYRFPEEYSGESSGSKRQRIGQKIRSAGADAAILTLPDSIAWLLNIRSSDLPGTPVVLAFAILDSGGGVRLYLDLPREIAGGLDAELELLPKAQFSEDLATIEKTALVDPVTAPMLVFDILRGAKRQIIEQEDPCIEAKAMKNTVEIASTVAAHCRDGAAVCEFLAWLDAQEPGGKLTELDVAASITGFRERTGQLVDVSFDTIAACGPNAAFIHYQATPASNRVLADGELLLVDSGGQYLDGTTDVTRTIAVGEPTDRQRACFTRVLKGLIALSRARWPRGLAGRDLDALARYHLWQAGLDYAHGTGHGVGHFLNVHEGPQRISRHSVRELLPGMVLSIEPGCYFEGEFGIRIENLAFIRESAPATEGGAESMLEFCLLTRVPVDRRLIDLNLLAHDEEQWIDLYHRTIMADLRNSCSCRCLAWLKQACAPLRQPCPVAE